MMDDGGRFVTRSPGSWMNTARRTAAKTISTRTPRSAPILVEIEVPHPLMKAEASIQCGGLPPLWGAAG